MMSDSLLPNAEILDIAGLFSVQGLNVLVTGGSRGIGLMIAAGFVDAGANVYLSSRKADVCARAAQELSKRGSCTAIPADLSDESGARGLAEEIGRREDHLDVLVNNAGATWGAPIEDHDARSWKRVLGTNVEGPFHLTKYCLPLLLAVGAKRPSRIINIGSVDGLYVPTFDTFSYGASKAAIHHLTRHLARTLGPDITVNAIAPGPFPTDMMEKVLSTEGNGIVEMTSLKRLGRPADIAGSVMFLASDAGSYLTEPSYLWTAVSRPHADDGLFVKVFIGGPLRSDVHLLGVRRRKVSEADRVARGDLLSGKPLAGVKVVEVAMFVYAPVCGAVLSDYGADVIKVEHPVGGDPFRQPAATATEGSPAGFMEICNHGKRSVGIDLYTAEGRAALHRLVAEADVFLTSFLPGARRKLGIDVDELKKINPRLVYAIASAHGNLGPEAELGGFDIVSAWARAGVANRISSAPNVPPLSMPPAFFDIPSGLVLAGGISMALFARERTGVAPVVEVSLLNTAMWALSPDIVMAPWGGEPKGRTTDRRLVTSALGNSYRTQDDRWLFIQFMQSDKYWPAFCKSIERADLFDDPRFIDHVTRVQNRAELIVELDAVFECRTLSEWKEILAGFDGPWAPFQTPIELHDDPQVVANGYMPEVTDQAGRRFKLVAPPIQFDSVSPRASGSAPEAGQQTEEVLLEVGLTWEDIAAGKELGAFQ